MTSGESFPRRFGEYLLTAPLSEDALGKVFRALRVTGERGFVRLRILESPEISEDAVLDSIQEYGEIHAFLRSPAIAREVEMNAVEGVPFIAWREEGGRTLDALLGRLRRQGEPAPIEHALFVTEKIASALAHAYNTIVDRERTLHGLVWPGFVSISDDGEVRLAGFGLAPAFYGAFEKPRFAEEITPYLAPGERSGKRVGKSSDVFSVGVILFELLAGRRPSPADPLEDVSALARQPGSLLPSEAVSLLRKSLAPAESRLPTAAELQRELARLLFSGHYPSSTFHLAFFVNSLFRSEVEEETRSRAREAALGSGAAAHPQAPEPVRREMASPPIPSSRAAPRKPATPGVASRGGTSLSRRAPVTIAGAALLAAAVAGGIFVVSRRPTHPASAPVPLLIPTAAITAIPVPTGTPSPEPAAPAPTVALPESQLKEEVSRRVAAKLKKLEEELEKSAEKTPAAITRTPAAEPARLRTPQSAAGPVPPPPPPTPEPAGVRLDAPTSDEEPSESVSRALRAER